MPKWRLFYHIVWATKDRQPVIDATRELLIRESLRETSRVDKVILHAVGVMPDHVHVAASVPPSVLLSRYIGRLKGASARAVNSRLSDRDGVFAWQAEYGVFSFSGKSLQDVTDYVTDQRTRHAGQHLVTIYEDAGTDDAPPP